MMKVGCIIQANRFGWDGSEDYSVKVIDGKYLVEHVIEKLQKHTDIKDIIIAVPNIKGNELFDEIAKKYNILCYFGSVDNVLDRFIQTSKQLQCDIIVKTLGQNCFLDTDLLNDMLALMKKNKNIDFMQTPDDFETKFTAEIFRSSLLTDVDSLIHKLDDEMIKKYKARPMSFVKANKDKFQIAIYKELPNYTDEYLKKIRESAKQIYTECTFIDYENQAENGNFYIERYKFAGKFIKQEDLVLDIACGSGYGTKYIYATYTKHIIGADLSEDSIKYSKLKYPEIDFQVQDATKTNFLDNQFDVILSMETFEHIPLDLLDTYLIEMKRVLKQNGIFICTTPQNSNGGIPIVPWHVKEYSLKEFKEILSRHFYLEKIYGSKNGIYTDDEVGNGMMAICRKDK